MRFAEGTDRDPHGGFSRPFVEFLGRPPDRQASTISHLGDGNGPAILWIATSWSVETPPDSRPQAGGGRRPDPPGCCSRRQSGGSGP